MNALVLLIDERPPSRPRAWLGRHAPPPGPAKPARCDCEYTRNGMMNLFAALARAYRRGARDDLQDPQPLDLIGFLEEIDETISPIKRRQIIAITDNLCTHTSHDVKAWLNAHPHRRLVFTPNHASWLKQVELLGA